MLYNWSVDDFIKERKRLEQLMHNEPDLRTKLYLQKLMDATDNLYHNTFNCVPRNNPSIKDRLISTSNSVLSYQRYYDLINTFMNICDDLLDKIDQVDDKLSIRIDKDDFIDTGAFYTQSRTLSLVDRFYSRFDTELYQYFSSVYKDRRNNLRFINKDEFESENSTGYTLFIGGVNKNFITIGDVSPVCNFSSLVHEYGHAIQNLINPDASYTFREDYFAEVPAIFPELVALYETDNTFEPVNVYYLMYSLFCTFMESADSLTLHMPITNLWAENNYKASSNFYDSLDSSFNIKKEEVKDILSCTLEEEGVYVLSYIASIELLHIYKRDKQKALRIFKEFLKIPSTEDPIYFISENLDLNSHLLEETEEMLDNFKKVL